MVNAGALMNVDKLFGDAVMDGFDTDLGVFDAVISEIDAVTLRRG